MCEHLMFWRTFVRRSAHSFQAPTLISCSIVKERFVPDPHTVWRLCQQQRRKIITQCLFPVKCVVACDLRPNTALQHPGGHCGKSVCLPSKPWTITHIWESGKPGKLPCRFDTFDTLKSVLRVPALEGEPSGTVPTWPRENPRCLCGEERNYSTMNFPRASQFGT